MTDAAAKHAEGTEVVLVVEDEATVRAPIARVLKSRGYYVLEAANGYGMAVVVHMRPSISQRMPFLMPSPFGRTSLPSCRMLPSISN